MKITPVPIACAGSPIPRTPINVNLQNYRALDLKDTKGGRINLNNYNCFIVKGDSMLLCGIRNNDILLSRPVKDPNAITFDRPRVLVLQRDQQALIDAISKDDLAKYKIRRAWAIVRMGEDDPVKCVRNIMDSQDFKDLKNRHSNAFQSNEEMLNDFQEERIRRYKEQYPDSEDEFNENHTAIISTTLRASKDNKVFFSIHPARIIVGEAVYSFHKQPPVC